MNISVIGVSRAGLVTGACLAARGHNVVCTAMDTNEVLDLIGSKQPFADEPGLPESIEATLADGHLRFTADMADVVHHSEVIYVATAPREDGYTDSREVFAAAEMIGKAVQRPTVVVLASRVRPGTTDAVRELLAHTALWHTAVLCSLVPLREGHCIEEFDHPERVVIGAREADWDAEHILTGVYGDFVPDERIVVTDVDSVESGASFVPASVPARVSRAQQVPH